VSQGDGDFDSCDNTPISLAWGKTCPSVRGPITQPVPVIAQVDSPGDPAITQPVSLIELGGCPLIGPGVPLHAKDSYPHGRRSP